MRALAKLPVAKRLGLGFGLVTVLIAAFAVLAWLQLQRIEVAFAEVVDDRYPKIDLARDIADAVNQQTRSLRSAIIAAGRGSAAQVDEFIALTEKAAQQNGDRLARLQQMETTPRGREVLARMQATETANREARETSLRLIRADKAQEAGDHSLGAFRPVQRAYLAAVDEMVEYQQSLMVDSAAAARHRVSQTLQSTVVLAAAVLALSVAFATAITRSLLVELGGEPAAARRTAQRIAAGDLSGRVQVRRGDETSLMAAMHAMQLSLVATVQRVRQGSESVAAASAQIALGNQDLSGRTEEQASALQQTAATMEQLGGTVRNTTDGAQRASDLAQAAARVASDGGGAVSEVVHTMEAISDSSRRVGDILGVIDAIAFQTNILALNAAVEAARAGEQGRGFAVVASEVRVLAQRSAEAAREIKSLIGRNVSEVERGVAQVERAGQTMQEIVGAIRRVSALIGDISTASGEQSRGIHQVGEAVTQLDQVTQQNAALVEESAAAAESLRHQAEQLVQAVAVFRV
ncbi:methyl-accepting chemotaxis protein [Pelomonas baiyunensis]|uniref:Methyl-accepting chemotaxis protein n=1 Tax=Pelomonas baiyunensis TaxID=3299026 RepID=A0ABW7GY94_9BURK